MSDEPGFEIPCEPAGEAGATIADEAGLKAALAEIRTIGYAISENEQLLQKGVEEMTALAEKATAPLAAQLLKRFEEVRHYCSARRADLLPGQQKSRVFPPHTQVGWHKDPDSLEVDDVKLLAAIAAMPEPERTLALDRYVRIKREPKKDNLKADRKKLPDAISEAVTLATGADRFFVKVEEIDLEVIVDKQGSGSWAIKESKKKTA